MWFHHYFKEEIMILNDKNNHNLDWVILVLFFF